MPAGYRRDAFTRVAFAMLAAFGVLNALLGPALPYLRAAEHTSYLVGSLHQVAFAIGGGVAGFLATKSRRTSRALVIRAGLAGAAFAAVGVAYGDAVAVTVPAAFVLSLLATASLIRIWAALADAHGRWRTVAMSEGEVMVSAGGVVSPLLVGALAGTALGWRFAFVVDGAIVLATVAASCFVHVPVAVAEEPAATRRPVRLSPTLVTVFAIVALEFSLSFWLASFLTDDVGLGRGFAAAVVSLLYAANLVGRVAISRLARRLATDRLLAGALALGLVGVVVLLTATGSAVALVGIAIAGVGIGATFPLIASLHVADNVRRADAAFGEVLTVAAFGQVLGPLAVALVAQAAGLRAGLVLLPALTLLGLGALARRGL